MNQTYLITFHIAIEATTKEDAIAIARDMIAERYEPSHVRLVTKKDGK
jgi:hypothetical protein